MTEELTKKEILDKVRKHFIQDENEPGWSVDTMECAYISDDRKAHCAVGVLLPEEDCHYLESSSAGGLPEKPRTNDVLAEVLYKNKLLRHWDFLRQLQAAHDTSCYASMQFDKYEEFTGFDLPKFRERFQKSLTELQEEFQKEE